MKTSYPFVLIFAIWSAIAPQVTAQSNIITTIAGTGTAGYNGDGIAATNAQLNTLRDVNVDAAGNIFIADYNNTRIRRIDAATGLISTVAGTGANGFSGDNGAASAARLTKPAGVFVSTNGDLLISDTGNNRVRRVDVSSGIITTIAGTGTGAYNGDSIPATTAQLAQPNAAIQDAAGNIYIGDYANDRIRKIDATTGDITTIAGTGSPGSFSGDGGPANLAGISGPTGMAFDALGNLYFSDLFNNRVRMIDTNGIITTVAGTGSATFNGDGIQATNASIAGPRGVAVDVLGRLFICDATHNRVRMVDTNGLISTIAGTGTSGFSGDGGPATAAQLDFPSGVFVDSKGNIYVADLNNHRVRLIAAQVGPTLTKQPVPVTQAFGGTALFSVIATGSGTLTYQWKKNTVDITGATSAALILTNLQAGDAGSYTVVVTDTTGSTTSQPATLTVAAETMTAAGLVAHWKFDEAPGSPLAVDSVGNYNGLLSGSGSTFAAGGRAGNAIQLTRTQNGFVSMGNVLSLTNENYTIVTWAKTAPGDLTDNLLIAVKHTTSTRNGYFVLINTSAGTLTPTKANFVTGGVGTAPWTVSETPTSTTVANDGNWHQIVAVHDRTGGG